MTSIIRNKFIFTLAQGIIVASCALAATTTPAQVTAQLDDCAQARDPVRCLARADAIAACASLHGTAKRDCLLTRLPPPDCKASPNPTRCQLEQDAKESCKSQQGAALRTCLKDHGIEPPKKGKGKIKRKASAKVKQKTSTVQ